MVTITVCVGSSCFLRGAPAVIEAFQGLIQEEASGRVELKGCCCMEKCGNGVSVMIEDRVFPDVRAEDVERVFRAHVLPVLEEKGGCGR